MDRWLHSLALEHKATLDSLLITMETEVFRLKMVKRARGWHSISK